eukprot:304792_1
MNKAVFDEDIISQLVALNVATRDEIINAMQNVTNSSDINEIMEYIDNNNHNINIDDPIDTDDSNDDDNSEQTIKIDQIFQMLSNIDNTKQKQIITPSELPYSLSEMKAILQQTTLIWNLNVPDNIVNIIAFCSLTELELNLNESLVLSCSAEEYSPHYGLKRLFTEHGVYCTKDVRGARYNETEIVIELSTKFHHTDPDEYNAKMDEHGFIITSVKIKPPGWGFTAPLKTFMMWIFNDKNCIPNEDEIRATYGGQIDVKTLDIYDTKQHGHLKNKDIEKKCVVCIDDIKKGHGYYVCKLYDDRNSKRVIKAKYILIKLMTPNGWDNVDTQHFVITVLRL